MNKLTRDDIIMDTSHFVTKEKPVLFINGDDFDKVVVTLDGTDYSFSLKTFAKALLKILKEVENEDTV